MQLHAFKRSSASTSVNDIDYFGHPGETQAAARKRRTAPANLRNNAFPRARRGIVPQNHQMN
jgi:hypothetical protein